MLRKLIEYLINIQGEICYTCDVFKEVLIQYPIED